MSRFATTIAKLKEPSTVRGILLMLSVIGLNIPDSAAGPISALVVALVGVYEMLRDEYT